MLVVPDVTIFVDAPYTTSFFSIFLYLAYCWLLSSQPVTLEMKFPEGWQKRLHEAFSLTCFSSTKFGIQRDPSLQTYLLPDPHQTLPNANFEEETGQLPWLLCAKLPTFPLQLASTWSQFCHPPNTLKGWRASTHPLLSARKAPAGGYVHLGPHVGSRRVQTMPGVGVGCSFIVAVGQGPGPRPA